MATYLRRYPGFEIRYANIGEIEDHQRFDALVARQHVSADDVGVPAFYLCNTITFGFIGPTTATEKFDRMLEKWTLKDTQVRAVESRSRTQPL
jgi:hypothetical protein